MFKNLSAKVAFSTMVFIVPTMEVSAQSICDGLPGAAGGLCNAYCEAMDCAGEPHASAQACDKVLQNFQKATGGDLPPCVVELEPCPCWTSADNIVTQFTSVLNSGDGIVIKSCSLDAVYPEIVANSSMAFAEQIGCTSTMPDPDDPTLGLHVAEIDFFQAEGTIDAGLKCHFNFPRCGDVIQPVTGSLTEGQVLGCRFDIRAAGAELCPE